MASFVNTWVPCRIHTVCTQLVHENTKVFGHKIFSRGPSMWLVSIAALLRRYSALAQVPHPLPQAACKRASPHDKAESRAFCDGGLFFPKARDRTPVLRSPLEFYPQPRLGHHIARIAFCALRSYTNPPVNIVEWKVL
jgi:hypothetical protein